MNYREIIFDGPQLATWVVRTTQEAKAQATADALATVSTRQASADTAAIAVTELDEGLNSVSLDIDVIAVRLSPAGRDADIREALTDSREGREKRSATRAALVEHKAYLTEIRMSGLKSVRPKAALASHLAQAELATANADHAACVAVECCGLSFAAGATQRAMEGGGVLYPAVGRTADLLAGAKRLYGVAATHWSGYTQERERQERGI